MSKPRYTFRLILLTTAILAGLVMEHGQKHQLAEAGSPHKEVRITDG